MKTHAIVSLAITSLLAFSTSLSAQSKQLQINTKVISVPMDAALLRDAGLSLESATGMSNLGVITPEKTAAMLAKIEKMPGFTLLNAPSIVAKSGTRATAESTRDFIYPSEFESPKLASSSDGKPVTLLPGQIMAASPSTPKAFEMRRTGFRIECESTVNAEGDSIEMNLAPELVTFVGFLNYGGAVKAAATDKDGKMQEVTLTDNLVQQPLFEVLKTVTAARIPSGHCLVLGGLGGSSQAVSNAAQPANLTQAANPMQKNTHAVFFFIQAKVFTP